jgi:hypothetical protein
MKYAIVISSLVSLATSSATFAANDDAVEGRLDRSGDWIENYLDRKGDRIDRHLDRKGGRIDHRLDRKGAHIATDDGTTPAGQTTDAALAANDTGTTAATATQREWFKSLPEEKNVRHYVSAVGICYPNSASAPGIGFVT